MKKKHYYHPIFIQYKKSYINLFPLCSMKKKFNKRKEKTFTEGKKTKLEIS